MSRLKDIVIAGLAGFSLALAALAWRQHVALAELRGAVAGNPLRAAAKVTIYDAARRNFTVVPPQAGAHVPDEIRAIGEGNLDEISPFRRAKEPPRRTGALARLVDNPEFLHALGVHRQAVLDSRFADLFRRLNLSDDELATFKRLLAEKENVALDVIAISEESPLPAGTLRNSIRAAQAEVEQAIAQSLGSERYAVYREYAQMLPHRDTVAQLQQRLSYSATPLTPAQADSMVQILATTSGSEAPPPAAVSVVLPTAAMPVLPVASGGSLLSDEAVQRATAVLAPPQVSALRDLQTEQQAAVRTAALIRDLAATDEEVFRVGLPLLLQ